MVGASGQVGSALCSALQQRGGSEEILRSSRVPRGDWLTLDVAALVNSNQALATVEDAVPDVILCAGGTTFVDGCEQSSAACLAANALGPASLAAYARSKAIPFVFFSSDYVFPGTVQNRGPYAENAPVHPLSEYGRSKLEGERLVAAAHPEALIVRTTVVYGPDAPGKNFLYTLLRHLSAAVPLRVPADQVSTPTYNRDIANAVLALLDEGVSGVVHVAGPELMDRLVFAREVAAFFGLDASRVEGVSTASLAQIAARPLLSGLETRRLEHLLPSLQRHTVQEALRDSEQELRRFLASLPAAVA